MESRKNEKNKQLIFEGLEKFNSLRFLFRDRFFPPCETNFSSL